MDVPHSSNKKQKKKKLSAKVWFNAVRNGNLEIIQHYLRSGWNVNKQDNNPYDCTEAFVEYWTALHIATIRGHTKIVKLLFEHGLDVTSIESWEAAFCLAVKEGHLEIVKLLLEHGADVNIIMHFRWPGGRPDGPGGSTSPTALEIAKQNGHMKVFGFISQWLEQKLNLDPFCTKTSSS